LRLDAMAQATILRAVARHAQARPGRHSRAPSGDANPGVAQPTRLPPQSVR
jgi:hypothetical protein